jgi:hypothetical protein
LSSGVTSIDIRVMHPSSHLWVVFSVSNEFAGPHGSIILQSNLVSTIPAYILAKRSLSSICIAFKTVGRYRENSMKPS